MEFKKNMIVVSITFLFMLSVLPSLTYAGEPEKVEVIIGFRGKTDVGLIQGFNGDPKNEIKGINAMVAVIPENSLTGLRNHPDIQYVEINSCIKWIQEDEVEWGVDRIDADIVWGEYDGAVNVTGNDGSGVIVAIVDTGIDYNHIELDDNYIYGYDFVNSDGDPWDDNGHGTHCAGIVAAEDNGIGVIGVAPGASLMAVKVLDSGGWGSYEDIANGIIYAANEGADVISMSLGGSSNSQALEDAVDYAYNKGCVVVAASGNSGHRTKIRDVVLYPARYASVIAVGATTITDKRASFSSTGPTVELAAPGYQILSTYPDNKLATMSGTSMACPHVSGVAALVIASGVSGNDNIRNKMKDTAEDLGDAGLDWEFGYGLVDAESAAGAQPDKHDVAISGINAPSSILIGNNANIKVTVTNEGTYAETTIVTLTDTFDESVIGSQVVSVNYGDSTIVSFNWDTASEELGEHVLEASASVVSGEAETVDNIMTATVNVYEEGQQTDMWVSGISWRVKQAGPNIFLYHTVTVMSNDGPVSSAMVYSILEIPGDTRDFSGATDSKGEVVFGFKGASNGTYTLIDIEIIHDSYNYNSELNEGVQPYSITINL